MVRARILIVVCALLALTGSIRADMMSGTCADAPRRASMPAGGATVPLEQAGPAEAGVFPGGVDLGRGSFGFLPAVGDNAEAAVDTHQCPILTDGLDSFSLCLYALMGLGVFRSGHYVRRCSFSFIPEWYHSGAPQQIGHSHAVGPDAFCHAAVCFVQPDAVPDRLMPLYRAGTIPSLVRTSQFTSDVLACRAPPHMA